MDSASKKQLMNYFKPEHDPEMTPAKRFTELDVKAVIYGYITGWCGIEDYSSASDSCCRDRIWDGIESLVQKSEKYINEEYYEDVYTNIVEYDSEQEYDDELEKDIKKILPKVALEYLENNPSATYTNILSKDHNDKFNDLIKQKIKWKCSSKTAGRPGTKTAGRPGTKRKVK
jgi:hypothetical protein